MFIHIRQWFSSPVFAEDEDKTRVAALLNTILWFFIVSASLYGVFAPIAPEMMYRRAIIIIPFVVAMLALKQLVNRGYLRLAGNLVVLFLWLTFTVSMLFGADYHNPAYMGYLVVVMCAGLILNWRSAVGWSVFSILTNAIFIELGQSGILPQADIATPPFAFWAAQTAYIVTSTFMLSQTLHKIDEARANAQHELNERKRATRRSGTRKGYQGIGIEERGVGTVYLYCVA